MPFARGRPLRRRATNGLCELCDIEEEVGLAAQIVRDHRGWGAEGRRDSDALALALQRKGKRVTVASTLSTPTPMISDDLRRQADFFLDVAELAKTVGRPPSERPAATERHSERTPATVEHK